MPQLSEGQVAEILLVEDNEGDVELTREALKDSKLVNNLHVTTDGEEALDFLYKRNGYESDPPPTPDLVLLDLNLPKISGHQVLKEIKNDNDLNRIPVVVLTSSEAEEDIVKSYDLNANCFVTKPLNFERFQEMVESLKEFWFSIVRLPDESQ